MFAREQIIGLWRVTSDQSERYAAFFADHVYVAPSAFRSELYARGQWSFTEDALHFEKVSCPEFPKMGQHSWRLTVRELTGQRMVTENDKGVASTWERISGEPDIDPAVDPFARTHWHVMHHSNEELPTA